ncbi:hypothetical protein P3X46_002196 [Hevea brasiliensis]|uniref:Uncharacterized protein n=1 Tax=Hevea brasiliensis TaxID=3981 RepID=A0ABQ9N255_HEVBR|nr:hypothetical protein P3X46_002196 [Hevea brasiliensis]
MSSLVSKSQPTLSEAENNTNNNNSREDEEDPEILSAVTVTSHVRLKPAHSTQTLDKEVVLRRIRQRKRHNKVRAAVQGFFGLPVSSKTDNKVSVKWVDDAFAAP